MLKERITVPQDGPWQFVALGGAMTATGALRLKRFLNANPVLARGEP